MLAREDQVLLGSAEVEIRVAKRVDVARTPQSQAGGNAVPSILARVMHQHYREAELPLQRAEIPEQFGDVARMILVDAMKPHQRIQHQQPGPKPPDCLPEPTTVP